MSQTLFSARVMRSCVRLSYCMGLLLFAGSTAALGEECKAVPAHVLSDAEVVFNEGDHAKAETMLKDELVKTPNDPDKSALLIRALLWPRKTSEAADVLNKALAAHPDSAALLTEKAEVLYREGKPWEVGEAIASALKADPCFPRAYLVYSWLMGSESNRASKRKAIETAHQLDPNDYEIRNVWLGTLTLKERIAAMEAWIASGTISDPNELKGRQRRLDSLKKYEDEPPRPCRMVSTLSATELPLQSLLREEHGNLKTAAYAVNVEIDGRRGLLQLDSGASGLTITKSLAEHAGLKPSGAESISGVGDEGPQHGYWAYADSLRIGGLEFKDCAVSVLEKSGMEGDGIIGVNTFSRFLVTIDYPVHRVELEPLPMLPDQPQAEQPSLATGSDIIGSEARSDEPANAPANSKAATPPKLRDRYVAPEMKGWVEVYRVGPYLITPGSIHVPDMKLFLVDTGSWTTLIAPQAASEVTKVDVNTNMPIMGLNGEVKETYVAEVLDFKFGGISKHELGVPAFPMERISQSTGMAISGVIGADILHELTLHIDYRDGLVKFEYDPKRGYHPPNR
jgi:predicted aspartyl protease